ncbi:hypothetical protein ACEPPN_009328 [Leptodophora sp. 'Broadleaf-Isolate-01']
MDDTKEEDWARHVADECDTSNYAPDITCTVGTIAYRQSYSNCSDSKWAAFKETFEALVMKRWTRDAEAGRDPRGMRHRWQVFWVEDEKLEGKSMAKLRDIWQQRTRIRTEWPTPHFFLMINDEVVDSVLRQATESQMPFVYAIDPEYGPLEEAEQDENDTVYKGYLTVAVEVVPTFWCEGGLDAGMAMEEFGQSDRLITDSFYIMLLKSN